MVGRRKKKVTLPLKYVDLVGLGQKKICQKKLHFCVLFLVVVVGSGTKKPTKNDDKTLKRVYIFLLL